MRCPQIPVPSHDRNLLRRKKGRPQEIRLTRIVSDMLGYRGHATAAKCGGIALRGHGRGKCLPDAHQRKEEPFPPKKRHSTRHSAETFQPWNGSGFKIGPRPVTSNRSVTSGAWSARCLKALVRAGAGLRSVVAGVAGEFPAFGRRACHLRVAHPIAHPKPADLHAQKREKRANCDRNKTA